MLKMGATICGIDTVQTKHIHMNSFHDKVDNGEEGNSHSCIYQTIIKAL